MSKKTHRGETKLQPWHMAVKIILLVLTAVVIGILFFGEITGALCGESRYTYDRDEAIEFDGVFNFTNCVHALFKAD